MKSWLKITLAVLCLLSILCFAVACGKDEQKESESSTDEPTDEVTVTDPVGTVDDNDDADDIGEEVILPPVKF